MHQSNYHLLIPIFTNNLESTQTLFYRKSNVRSKSCILQILRLQMMYHLYVFQIDFYLDYF